MIKKQTQRIHFIGIGGVGMSGIARVAHDQGMQVTGSDLRKSRYTEQLEEAGIPVYIGHEPEVISKVKPDIVVISTAILDNNPELIAAKEQGVEVWHRAKMLAALGAGRITLAVTGTHGKTTTSSMLASTLEGMGEDPSFLIGGEVQAYATNARSGGGKYYVVEADESDKSFIYLNPSAILVTNIEADHLDHYSDLNEIFSKFEEFISSVSDGGVCLVCGEDASLVNLAQKSGVEFYTYGFGDQYDISVSDFIQKGIASEFTLTFPDNQHIHLNIKKNPGRHNALNAAGVIGLIWALGLSLDKAAKSFSHFSGVKRRFDLVGEVGGITIVDDYAHHPTEIEATIKAAKNLGFNRIHVVFQPHRYSRVSLFTEVLKEEFGRSFDEADAVVFMDVYAAGETPVPGISGKTFMDVIDEHLGHPPTVYLPRRVELVPYLVSVLEPGDLVFTMGAGDVTAIGPQLLLALEKAHESIKGATD